ncbi:hypothetical protein MMC31_005301 [Peltigera leucophlebia]|nr:hypothetical protein [Peltigera leucophlebia]
MVHPAMLSMLLFQLFALLFLTSFFAAGSDPDLRVGDTPFQLPYDGADGLGNLASPDQTLTNKVLAQSPNSDSNQQSLGLPATLQSAQCQLENINTPSGKGRRRRQLPQYCPQPLAPAGEEPQQQRQINNGDLKIHTGPFRGRNGKKPDPNIIPDVFIVSPESEQKRQNEICPPIHPPIHGVIPLTIPLCALDEHARPDRHIGFAGMKFSAWGCLPVDPNHPVHAVYTIEDIPDAVPGIDDINGIEDITGLDGMPDDDDTLDLNGP